MEPVLVTLLALAFGQVVLCEDVRPMEQLRPHSSFTDELIGDVLGDLVDTVGHDLLPEPHIVGGEEVVPHSHPHQVALFCQNSLGQSALCGGSLITPEWVLTAAHCTMNVKSIMVLIGAHNVSTIEPTRQEIPVEKIALTNTWNPRTNLNDIALLKLAKPATLNEYVQTIRLPALSLKNKMLWRTPVTMTGWGRNSDSSVSISPVLRSVESKVVTNVYCNIRFGMGSIVNSMICADGNQVKGVCNGDSGGPMVMTEADGQKTVIGITSFGSREGCEKKYPTVFTRVDEYLDWISKITGLQLRTK